MCGQLESVSCGVQNCSIRYEDEFQQRFLVLHFVMLVNLQFMKPFLFVVWLQYTACAVVAVLFVWIFIYYSEIGICTQIEIPLRSVQLNLEFYPLTSPFVTSIWPRFKPFHLWSPYNLDVIPKTKDECTGTK